ncbi:hypothetical protein [Aureimonas sp. AU12]|uniref:hypothetical protein n=1 Tax=Aureimonas sp. AU12 TaxID=1638161 RepID=UPI000ABF0B17|nr:hypothetical protein [Aureimonas sp. AU12]
MSAAALNKSHDIVAGDALKKSHDIRPALTMPIGEVASAMGLTERSLMRKHKRLSVTNAFPPPLPGGVWMWSRAAFEAWVRANGVQSVELDRDEPTTLAGNDRTLALVTEQNASLRARYSR